MSRRPALLALAVLASSLSAAAVQLYLSQRDWFEHPPPLVPFLLLVLALLVLLWVRRRDGHAHPAQPAAAQAAGRQTAGLATWRIGSVLLSALLTVVLLWRLPQLTPDDSYAPVFFLWLSAGAALFAAVAAPLPSDFSGRLGRLRRSLRAQRHPLFLLAGILLLALLLRVPALETIPHTLAGDEASQGLEAVRVLEGELRNPFTTGWYSVPTLGFFFNSISLRLLGISTGALRLPWALVGSATVLVTFFLVLRLQGTALALVTAALLATYHYHIHYSRLGSNQIADPLFLALTLLFLFRGLDRRRAGDWFLSGAVAALALYFYAGARFTPVVVLATLSYYFLRRPRTFWQRHRRGLPIMLAAFLVVGAPMLQFAIRFPDLFNARVNQVGIFQSGWFANELTLGYTPLQLLWDQFRRAALAFNYYPDRRPWYGLPGPLLDPAFGVLFLLGLGYATVTMWGNDHEKRRAPLVFWWWGGILLGGMLTESPPSSQRLITVSVPVTYFIALAGQQILYLLDRAFRNVPRRALAAFVVLAFAAVSLKTYFIDYTPQRIYGGIRAEMATDIAPLLRQLDDEYVVYFVGAPWMYWEFATIPFLAPAVEGRDVEEPLAEFLRPDPIPPGRGALFVLLPERRDEIQALQEAYPEGEPAELRATATDDRLMAILYFIHP